MNLVYPLEKKGTKTSGFGNRNHPIKKKQIHHNGIDIGVPDGTSVIAVADGEVVRSDMKDKNGYGNFIIIKHDLDGQTKYSCYAHLTKRLVDVGDKVTQGEEIAKSGGGQGVSQGGGMSTGPHLHFEIRNSVKGDWEDPEKYISSSKIVSGPVKKDGESILDSLIKSIEGTLGKSETLKAISNLLKNKKSVSENHNRELIQKNDKLKKIIKKIL